MPEDAQCLLVRAANRSTAYIKRASLQYDEIANPDQQISYLRKRQWLGHVEENDFSDWLLQLTKPELQLLLAASG